MSSNNEAALQRLANALALGDGFQFHILVCPSPLQVRQSLSALAEGVPARRGGSLITRPLLPDTFSPDKPLDSALTAAVTEALSTLPPPAADERVLAVLDASFVAETEIPAWRQLFRRLNEQRNAVAGNVNAALLLCLSPSLEPIFAHEAPDFWSIRGVSVRLEAEAPAPTLSSQRTLAAPSADISLAALASTADELPALRQAVEALRQRASAYPDDLDIKQALAIQIGRLGDTLHRSGSTQNAVQAYLETRALLEHLIAIKPDIAGIQANLAVTYERLGDLMTALGQGDEARDYFLKALDIAQRLAQAEPQRADYQRDLSVSYERLGDLMTALGQGDEARDYFLKRLAIAQRLAQAEPQRADYQRDLIVSLVRIAQTDPPHAVEHLRRALDIALALQARGLLVEGLDEMIAALQAMLAEAGEP